MYPNDLYEWWSHLSHVATGALQAATAFTCLSLLMYRKDLRAALKKVVPTSLRFNFLIFVFDSVLVVLPLSYLAAVAQQYLSANSWVLFDGAHLTHIHPAVVFLLAIFFGDFIAYFRHRLEHSRLLWPSHVMHHSDTDMNWTTVYRFHPINRLTTVIIDNAILVIFGFPPLAVAVNGLFRNFYGMVIHANVPWTYGRYGLIFVSPAMHRWHHVLEGQGVGSNFGSVFALFDRLFGTYYLPGPCDRPLGVPDLDNDAFLRQMALPVTQLAAFFAKRVKPLVHG